MNARRLIGTLVLALLASNPAHGWHDAGHAILTKAALLALPDSLPAFFRSAGREVAHYAYEPDVSKEQRDLAPYVRAAEYPEHFLDLEFLQGNPLPKYRYEYLELCYKIGVKPQYVGLLPYAIAEWTQRLAVAFHEHRVWPDNPMIRQKCFVYAGFLAHYAQDFCQPLHLTADWDGRANPDGSSPRSGIHDKVDWMVEMLDFPPADLARAATVTTIAGDLMDTLLPAVLEGNGMVDAVYGLEPLLPDDGEVPDTVDPRVVSFARARSEAAVGLLASLYTHAWTLSSGMKHPFWADRAVTDAKP